MSLRIVVVRANYLRNKNELNNKERKKKKREREKLTVFIYQLNIVI